MAATLVAGCAGSVGPEGRRCLLAANNAYQRGDDDATVRASSRFLQLHPRLPQAAEAHYLRGLARCRGGQTAAAGADLAEAIALAKRKDLAALAHAKLGDLAYRAGEISQAEKHYRAALASSQPAAAPADQALFRLGCILQRRGQWAEGRLMLRRLTYLFPATDLARRAAQRVNATCWSVQVGAFDAAAAATNLRGRLKGAGFDARVELATRAGRLMRLVRVGRYATYQAGRADLTALRKVSSDAFLTPGG